MWCCIPSRPVLNEDGHGTEQLVLCFVQYCTVYARTIPREGKTPRRRSPCAVTRSLCRASRALSVVRPFRRCLCFRLSESSSVAGPPSSFSLCVRGTVLYEYVLITLLACAHRIVADLLLSSSGRAQSCPAMTPEVEARTANGGVTRRSIYVVVVSL